MAILLLLLLLRRQLFSGHGWARSNRDDWAEAAIESGYEPADKRIPNPREDFDGKSKYTDQHSDEHCHERDKSGNDSNDFPQADGDENCRLASAHAFIHPDCHSETIDYGKNREANNYPPNFSGKMLLEFGKKAVDADGKPEERNGDAERK